jgi:predicted Zn-dependent protease with MMP-like domain
MAGEGLKRRVFIQNVARIDLIFNLPSGPDHIALYQKNIEPVCSSEIEVREQIRLTFGHHIFCITDPDGNGITIYTSHAI